MACRGPDAEGAWLSPHAAFGHRRLSIIDIEGGRQPMIADEDGRPLAVLTYSGEIYNFVELRQELGLAEFETKSDTEAILVGYQRWGDRCVSKLRGMFAFALWDAKKDVFLAARDRAGVKPLFYCDHKGSLMLSSEIKSLLAFGGIPRDIDEAAMLDNASRFIVAANTTWAMIDRESGRLARVRPEIAAPFIGDQASSS